MRKMQRKVVKIAIFFLSLLCLLSALGGCAKPDETAFLAEAERLLTEAEKVNVLCKDICALSGEEILNAAQIDQQSIYLLAGCPPCQNFSRQNPENKNKTVEERKKLLFKVRDVIALRVLLLILTDDVCSEIARKRNADIGDIAV